MKRYLCCILASVVFIPVLSFAAAPDMSGATPVQSFQEADSQNPPSSPLQTKPVEKPKAANKSTTPTANAVSNPKNTPAQNEDAQSKPTPNNAGQNSPVDHDSTTALQAELTQLNQNNLQFQQQTDERLDAMNSQNQQLQQQLQSLERALMLLNQELVQIKQAETISHHSASVAWFNPSQWATYLKQKLGTTGYEMVIGGSIVILLALVWSLWPRKKKKTKNQSVDAHPPIDETSNDTEDEYDYMGSAESIPAKINLARTYMAMEDHAAARKVLEEVKKLGNEEQREEAKKLLEELSAVPAE